MNIVETPFTQYELTDDEKLQGFVLNAYQRAVLQTELSIVAQQLISLKMDTSKPYEFAVDQAALQGQKEMLETILERSKSTEQLMHQLNSSNR